ncbi:alpha-ketoglutarate-dependent dioxygenase alkB-like isoform X1 [Zingiber officinale]|uniref:alpha-ketoglutarate-dependent dioxygenase alkB-like isoform X1 n=1 Tax=Zingiber officinale TaxID=94328 RepID=UPI001C4D8AF7|nr:alpha-ketoglutarate-dependent dioxygenase alkB-like isoform X1 [Zingiber officinale]
MYGAQSTDEEPERTAFRLAEKRYKLYKSLPPKTRKKPVLNQTDLSDVVDFHAILESVDLIDGIFRLDCPGFDRPVFCFRDRPGFYFIPRALTIEEQCYWIRQSLVSFPQPPNRTSLTAIYGPISDLFAAVQNKKILVEAENTVLSLGDDKIHSGNYIFSESNANTSVEAQGSFKSVSASTLLRKLRWGTLGLQFNWSKRNYDFTLPHNKIPEKLCQLAKEMAVPAMPSGEEFQPEAAIVNYFGPSDMLGGHLDDMEADWSKPIVSISLGCKAIFLLGGTSREDVPVSMFLRSGDIVLMAGKARECFHGVPRIFTDDKHAEVSVLLSQFSGEDDCCITDYIKNSRININIRQVN